MLNSNFTCFTLGQAQACIFACTPTNMIFSILICTCATLLIGLLFSNAVKSKGKKKLSGPTPIPIFGNAFQIGFRPHLRFTEWAKQYGPIYKIKIGFKDAIIINNHQVLKDIFSEAASAGRPQDNCVMKEISKGPYGLINSEGETWTTQRKFTVKTLRSFGFSKTSMETMILDEVETLLDWFKKNEGSPVSGVGLFNAPVINSLWRIVSSERCEWENGRSPILDAADEFFSAVMTVCTNGVYFAPFLKTLAPEYFGWNRFVESRKILFDLFSKTIEKHKETFTSHDLRDFIDHQLLEIGNETDPRSSFYQDIGYSNLISGLFDLFIAGFETTSNLLSWSVLYLSEFEEIQKKLQKEIDNIVGSRIPSLVDRNRMPYTEAVIYEVMRISSVAALTPHRLLTEMVYQGYHLPKGAMLFGNIYGAHYDLKVWGDPENFRPERFLSEDQTKLGNLEGLVPFSEGKRKCLGDTMAKDSSFLFLTAIFQKFNVIPTSSGKKSDFEADFGFVLAPKPYKVLLESRKL